MLIDKLKRDHPNIVMGVNSQYKIKDAITFFINESGNDFTSRNLIETPLELPTKFPFENIFLQLHKFGLWLVSKPDYFYVTSFLKYNAIPYSILVKDSSPKIFYKGFLDNLKITSFLPMATKDIQDLGFIDKKMLTQIFIGHVKIIVPFLNILSCKNIRTKKITPNRKKKYHKKPLFSYYILQICSNNNTTSKGKKDLWSNRVHLCRGHIKSYTTEKPLFGKYIGNVWCPPHVRGNKSKGVIQKDYVF